MSKPKYIIHKHPVTIYALEQSLRERYILYKNERSVFIGTEAECETMMLKHIAEDIRKADG